MDITKAHRAFSIIKKITILEDFENSIFSSLNRFEESNDEKDDEYTQSLTTEIRNFTVNICKLNRTMLEKDLEKL